MTFITTIDCDQTGATEISNYCCPPQSTRVIPFAGDYQEPTESGIFVDRDRAMTHGVVLKCVQLISNYVAKTPFRVQRTTGSAPETDRRHPANRLLKSRANPMMSALQLRKTLMFHVLLHGNGYAWIVRDRKRRPIQLIPLLPERTGLLKSDSGRLMYFTHVDHEYRQIMPRNVLHIRGLSFDGLTGLSVIEYMAESMGLSIAARTFGSKFFSNGATPSGFASVPESLDDENRDAYRENFEKAYTSLSRSHRVMLLEEGITFTSNSIPQDQAQFLETRKYEDTVMLPNWFGVPSHRVGGDIQSSYNSLEQENQAFIDDGIDPHLCNWEAECNLKLLTPVEQRQDSRACEFDRDALKRIAFENLITTWLKELNDGGLTLNEYRGLRGRAATGPDGDRYRMPQNIGFIDEPEEPEATQLVQEEETDDVEPPAVTAIAAQAPEKVYIQVPRVVPIALPAPLNIDTGHKSANRELLTEFVRMQCFRVRTKVDRASEKCSRFQKFVNEPGIEQKTLENFQASLAKPLEAVCQANGGKPEVLAEQIATEFVRPVFEELRSIASAALEDDFGPSQSRVATILACLDSPEAWEILANLAF